MSEYAKGEGAKDASYAAGGGTLGRTRDFMKEPGAPDQTVTGNKPYKNPCKADDSYEKSGKDPLAKRTGEKCLPTVKPRK